jgi:hypothetical protein
MIFDCTIICQCQDRLWSNTITRIKKGRLISLPLGDDSSLNDGLPQVPNATDWPEHACASLTGHVVDAPMVSAVIAVVRKKRLPFLFSRTTIGAELSFCLSRACLGKSSYFVLSNF